MIITHCHFNIIITDGRVLNICIVSRVISWHRLQRLGDTAEQCSRVARNLEENLTDDAGHPLVQDLTHHKVEKSLLVFDEHCTVVRVPGQLVEGVGGPPQHVQAGAHTVRVVPQSIDPVLLRHHQSVGLRLLDEADQQTNSVLLQCNSPAHTR